MPGEHRVRVHVMPGREHERALVRSRVRQRKVWIVAMLAGHGDDVDVERARPPPHQANPLEGRLNLVQLVEELARRDRDVGEHDRVQVVRLRRAADRHRLVDRRHARQLDPLDSRDRVHAPLEDVAPGSEVTAQGEDGLPRDDVKAVDWYRKAANQGLPKAETNLGDMYFFGRGGLAQSYLDALSWYLKASQQDAPDAQYRLGYMYEKGLGTTNDPAKAVQLYRSAADHGYAEAQNLMGIFYATGTNGIAQDDKQAVAWYQKAADQGFAKAEKNLGDMYFFGRGVDRDYLQAKDWYGKAADQKLADAEFRLGYMYEKGLGVEQSNQDAIDHYTKAVRSGSVDAQRALDRLAPVKQ